MDLFPAPDSLTSIPIDDGQLHFLARLHLPGDDVLSRLIAETAWRAETITLWGQRRLQPRLTAWYGSARYSYSGMTLEPLPPTALLLEIQQAVETVSACRFNSALLNYYRDQNDSIGFHSDDEAELGTDPVIASLSVGAPRTFILRHKRLPKSMKLNLGDGSLLLMGGKIQTYWQHGINKERQPCGPRVNLTFRNIVKK
jgi:alkylated DNA repair dioxygenase AlkB